MYIGSADIGAVRARVEGKVKDPTASVVFPPRDSPRGWLVVLGSVLIQIAVFGVIPAFPVLTKPMENDPDLGFPSRRALSVANGIASGAGLWIGFIGGYLVDRFGPRILAAVTTVTLLFALIVPPFACRNATELVVLYGIPAALAGAMANSPMGTVVGWWFDKQLPLAMGVIGVGGGVGTTVVPLVAGLMSEATNNWRLCFKYLSLFSICCALAIPLLSRRLTPEVLESKQEEISQGARFLRDLRAAVQYCRSLPFVIMSLFGFCFGFTFFGIAYVAVPLALEFGHEHTPYATSLPLSEAKASTLFVWFGVSQAIGSFLTGALGWAFQPAPVYAMVSAIGALGSFGLALSRSYYELAAAMMVLGFAFSGNWALYPTMVVDRFSGPLLGLIMGLTFASIGLGGVVGPVVIALLANSLNRDYTASIVLTGVISLVGGAICHLALPPPEPVDPTSPRALRPSSRALAFPERSRESSVSNIDRSTTRSLGRSSSKPELDIERNRAPSAEREARPASRSPRLDSPVGSRERMPLLGSDRGRSGINSDRSRTPSSGRLG